MYSFIFQLKIKIVLFLTIFILFFGSSSIAQTKNIYGTGLNADGLANLEIGKYNGRVISYRFRAEHTGNVDRVRIYLIYASGGYYKGDGGDIRVELRTDDGTSNHFPSETVLASQTITNPMATNFPLVTFSSSASLQEGTLYHLVFTNTDADPVNNYVSIDDLYNSSYTPDMQPVYDDIDLAVVWKYTGSSSWAINYGHTPIFCLSYTSGKVQGVGYINASSVSGVRNIFGSSKIRAAFTVSGANKNIRSVNIRVKKVSGASDLIVRIEESDGTLIEQGSISQSLIASSMTWVQYTFNSSHNLINGQSYNVVLSSTSGHYETFAIVDGTAYGFDTGSTFADGKLQYTTGSSWINDNGGRGDMQFYFDLSDSENSLLLSSPQNLRVVSTY